MTRNIGDAAQKWWKATKDRLAPGEAHRVEISIRADDVRSSCIEVNGGDGCQWFENHHGNRLGFDEHETIHAARKAVVALAHEIGGWKLEEDNAYSLVFVRIERNDWKEAV